MLSRVFIVEDEAIVALELKDHLRQLGYEVCGHAVRGDAALLEIPPARPDVVLMDIKLAGDLSGLDVAEQLRVVCDVPVILLTAYADSELSIRAGRTESFAYLTKPFDPRVLAANLELAIVRHRSQAALRDSEARFRALFEQANVGVAEFDVTTQRLTRVNRKYCEIVGYSEAELLALDVPSHASPDDQAADAALMEQMIRGEVPEYVVERRYVRKDGTTLWGRRSCARLWQPGEAPTRVMVGLIDITENKRAQEVLEHSSHEIDEAERLAGLGRWTWDLPTNAMRWSAHLFEIFGLPPSTVGSESFELFSTLVHPDDSDRMAAEIRQCLLSGGGFETQFRVLRPDGSERVIEERGVADLAPDGRPVRLRGTSQDITERTRAADALAESERRYRRLFDESIESMFEVSADGTILRVNHAMVTMVGCASPEELVGTNQSTLYADPLGRRRIEEAHPTETIAGIATDWRRRNGELIHVEIFARMVRAADGTPAGYHGVVRDVTAQRQYDAALRVLAAGLSRQSGRSFFEAMAQQLAAAVGADIGFVRMLRPGDPSSIRTVALAVDGAVTTPRNALLSGTPGERVVSGETLVIRSGVRERFPADESLAAVDADGYAATPFRNSEGAVIGYVGIVTRTPMPHPERIEIILVAFALRAGVEIERERAEERFGGVFEFAPDAILIVDTAGSIVTANRMAEDTFGYSRSELQGLSVEQLVPAERISHARWRKEFIAHLQPRRMGANRSVLWALRKDGTLAPVEISLSPFQSTEGDLVVAVIRDVTVRLRMEQERARLEEKLRQTQKMESLGTLAGGIAHDFNNLLGVIVGSTETALARLQPSHPVADNLRMIGTASSRASNLVDQILAFSRRQPLKPASTSVGAIVDEVVTLLRAVVPASIEITTTVDGESRNVVVDATQIHQVLMNIGTNAWHAIAPGAGTIAFRLDTVALDADAAASPAGLPPGRYVRVAVSDDGHGMDSALVDRVFDPFFTTKGVGEGTGLGLSVAHGIVADHGGAIVVESALDEGTTFSVYLPETLAVPAAPPPTPVPTNHGATRVLLVDDDELILRLARHLLERLGLVVSTSSKPADALESIRRDPLCFDVVITDLSMPEMNGLELAEAIATVNPDLPIVLTTGNRAPGPQVLRDAGIRGFVAKPYTGAVLRDAIDGVLKRR